jgi:monoamine oxidase
VQTNRYTVPIPTKRVVLALPQRALQILAPTCEPLRSGNVPELLNTVTGRKVMKIFLAYDEPWWEKLDITDGSSSTDLPLGQAWYFGAPKGAASTKSLLMASYNDTLTTTYWEGLESGETFENPAGSEDTLWTHQAPSQLMVNEVQRQLAVLHGIEPPAPYAASYRDWSLDPYGGAFYTWNVGVRGDETRAAVLEPIEGFPLNVCGSAYSVDQGWAEGALATAEQVVTDKIGLVSPRWLE